MDLVKAEIFLRVDQGLVSLKEIVGDVDRFKKLCKRGEIDLYTTEGALSVVYDGIELLGEEFWDEINIVLDSLVVKSIDYSKGKTIKEYMPLQSFWISIQPMGDNALWGLQSATKLKTFSLNKLIPSRPLFQALALSYIKMAKVLSLLGSESFTATVEAWSMDLPSEMKSIVLDAEELSRVAKMEIREAVTYHG